VSKAVASPAMVWTPNGAMTSIAIRGVTNPCGTTPIAITITKITQDEPVTGGIYGKLAPDGAGIGKSTAQVRAERADRGNGRVYTISFTARDAAGHTSSGSVTVGVPVPDPKKRNAIICIDDGQKYDSTAKK
jgi:hypothetical protein